MRTIVMLALAAASMAAAPARAQEREQVDAGEAARAIDPAKVADIRKLLEVTGSARLAKQTVVQMLPSMKQLVPQAPAAFWDEFVAEIDEDELIQRIVPVYDRHFSHAEVKALLAFYASPLGKRLIEELPNVAAESMRAGQEWGQEIGRRVMRRALERRLHELDEEEEAGADE